MEQYITFKVRENESSPWIEIPALKGDKGDPGATGSTPERGIDYWTDADKQEIVNSTKGSIQNATTSEAGLMSSADKQKLDDTYTKQEVDNKDVAVLSAAKDYSDNKIAALVDSAPEALNTLGELAEALNNHEDAYDGLLETVGKKANEADLAAVAKSGSYNDLTDTPTSLPANGGNAATVAGHTVAINVPADAKFTDTTYENVTTSEAGLMSAGDKTKLDKLENTKIEDSLTSTATTSALSANQGKVINDKIGSIESTLETISTTPGKSAYDVAVDNGFQGTEQEWLASLKGEDGTDGINGTKGADGQDGADGEGFNFLGNWSNLGSSTYFYSSGTERSVVSYNGALYICTSSHYRSTSYPPTNTSRWELFMPAGTPGNDGADGRDGQDGTNGIDGTDGQDGKDGSAWFTGTAVQGTYSSISVTVSGQKEGDFYLNTSNYNLYKATSSSRWSYVGNIKGAQGIQGEQGEQGIQGEKGDKGDTGASGTVDTSVLENYATKLNTSLSTSLAINTSGDSLSSMYFCDTNGDTPLYVNNDLVSTGPLKVNFDGVWSGSVLEVYDDMGDIIFDVDADSYGVTSLGSMHANNGFFETSDIRLKDVQKPLFVNLEDIVNIPKFYFNWNTSDKQTAMQVGTSAQEVQKYFPELVHENKDGYLSVAYDKLSIVALAAIDKLHDENNILKERLDRLENMMYGGQY